MSEKQSTDWCIVLGASSGMGKACVRLLSKRGMNVVGVHLDPAENQSAVDELITEAQSHGVEARFFNENAAGDPGRARVLDEMQETLSAAGGVKILVHSLAFGSLLPFIRHKPGEDILSRRQMDMTLSVMAHSLVYWVQDLFGRGLLQAGAKVFALTSAGSTKVTRNYGAVSAAKCALESHVRQLALELAPDGIAVNAIRAGVTVTPSLERIPEHRALIEYARRANPHSRLTQTDDVAAAIALLSAATSSWMTGNVIGVDGGEMLTA
jgi:enoyl-[acyl-carrier protein] reductase III